MQIDSDVRQYTEMLRHGYEMVLLEAFPECYVLYRELGEETFMKLINLLGDGHIRIPSAETLHEVVMLYFKQEGITQNNLSVSTYKEAIKKLKSKIKKGRIKAPSEIVNSMNNLANRQPVDFDGVLNMIRIMGDHYEVKG